MEINTFGPAVRAFVVIRHSFREIRDRLAPSGARASRATSGLFWFACEMTPVVTVGSSTKRGA